MNFYKVEVVTDHGVEEQIVRSKNRRNAITNVLTNIVKADNVYEVSCQEVQPQFMPVIDKNK